MDDFKGSISLEGIQISHFFYSIYVKVRWLSFEAISYACMMAGFDLVVMWFVSWTFSLFFEFMGLSCFCTVNCKFVSVIYFVIQLSEVLSLIFYLPVFH